MTLRDHQETARQSLGLSFAHFHARIRHIEAEAYAATAIDYSGSGSFSAVFEVAYPDGGSFEQHYVGGTWDIALDVGTDGRATIAAQHHGDRSGLVGRARAAPSLHRPMRQRFTDHRLAPAHGDAADVQQGLSGEQRLTMTDVVATDDAIWIGGQVVGALSVDDHTLPGAGSAVFVAKIQLKP